MIYGNDNIHAAMEKVAIQFSRSEKAGLSGAGIGVALGAALLLRSKAGLRAEVGQYFRGIGRGGSRKIEEVAAMARGTPPEVAQQAKRVADMIRRSGLDPKKINIAVSGAGGTGKSTFVAALGKELNMPGVHLDRAKIDYLFGKGSMLSKYLETQGHYSTRGNILEQTHLMTKINPKAYDIAIHMERPTAVVRKQTLARGRGAAQLDLYNYPKVKGTIRKAFETLPGHTNKIDDVIQMKFAPRGGFHERRLDAAISSAGINPVVKGRPMTREQKLLSLYEGQAMKSHRTWGQYMRGDTLVSIPAAIMAAPMAGAAIGIGAMKTPDAVASMQQRRAMRPPSLRRRA